MTRHKEAHQFDPNALFTLSPREWDDRTRALAALGEMERTLTSGRGLPDRAFLDDLVRTLIRNWARGPT
jgi:hypothetical protein